VTKKDIVKAISEKINMTQLTTKEIVQQTFDTIVETLVRDGRIELRNFGVFEAKERAARRARNPRTGVRVDVPSKIVVTFKPGKEMEEKVRQMDLEVLDRLKVKGKKTDEAIESSMSTASVDQPETEGSTGDYSSVPDENDPQA
jgi:integration host factor subunit beta